LQTIVVNTESWHGILGRAWISDRGMASADNLARQRQRRTRGELHGAVAAGRPSGSLLGAFNR
jgi:NADH:ubiquinone oxidoreductase subunit